MPGYRLYRPGGPIWPQMRQKVLDKIRKLTNTFHYFVPEERHQVLSTGIKELTICIGNPQAPGPLTPLKYALRSFMQTNCLTQNKCSVYIFIFLSLSHSQITDKNVLLFLLVFLFSYLPNSGIK